MYIGQLTQLLRDTLIDALSKVLALQEMKIWMVIRIVVLHTVLWFILQMLLEIFGRVKATTFGSDARTRILLLIQLPL